MKKYKSNYVFTTMFQLCNIFLSGFPGIFIVALCFEPQAAIYTPLFGCGIVCFFVVIGNILHFIISVFTKPIVYIDEHTISVKSKNAFTQCMAFEDVAYVEFDEGVISKFSNDHPASIRLFNKDYSQSLIIGNPSFFMIVEINKRCRKANFKFKNYKWHIVLCSLFTAFIIFWAFFKSYQG